MDEVPMVGRDDGYRTIQELSKMHGGPAYVRRGRLVEESLEQLLGRCRQQRDEWLRLTRIHLGILHGLAGAWEAVRPWVADVAQLGILAQLYRELRPQLRHQVTLTSSPRLLRRALHELLDCIEMFNRRWEKFLPEVDLTPVNEARDGYNRYYVLEKECAVRSPRVARQGFSPLPPLTTADLAALLPPLPVPRLRE